MKNPELLAGLAKVALADESTCACDRLWLQQRIERGDWIPADVQRVCELLPTAFRVFLRDWFCREPE
jgi:hypothetical protein